VSASEEHGGKATKSEYSILITQTAGVFTARSFPWDLIHFCSTL